MVALIGSMSFYLVSHGSHSPKGAAGAAAQHARTDTQDTSTSDRSGKQDTATNTTPNTPTTTAPKTGSATTTGGSTGSSGGTTNATGGGGSNGGGTTTHGPIALKIMPLGDSITQGGVGGDPRTINSYRLQLWNDLGSDYQIDYVGSWQHGDSQLADTDENGFSGDCIVINPCHGDPSLYSRTAGWITAENPDLVIMQGGGNDFSDPSTTETSVETSMENWISLVFATKPSVKIIVTGAPQWYPNYSTALQNYVNQQKAAGKPIRYVTYDNVDTVDGTHPSLAGYVTWGDALAAKVRELFP